MNIAKKIILFLLVIFSTFSFIEANASISSYSQNVNVSRRGSSASQVINTPPFGIEKQIYSVDISGNYDGHGALGPSGGKYGISVCISNVGSMWNGSCWNVVDPNGAGNIGDAAGSIPGSNVSIGATSNNFNYFNADVYVNDADANVTFTMYGREVSIDGFNTTNSTMAVGGDFDITWDVNEQLPSGSPVELSYTGPVNCPGFPSPSNVPTDGGVTCSGTSVGTGTFYLDATGYSGTGDKNISGTPVNVSIIAAQPNCGNGVINAGEQCDAGVNNGSCPRACSNSCTVNSCSAGSCGNGVVESGEQCDTGGNNGGCPRACSNSCSVNSCGGTISTLTFTATGPGVANGYSSSAVGQPLTFIGSCRNATCSLPLPTGTYVTIDAVHDTAGGPFTWTPLCPAGGVGIRCEGPLNANYSAGVTFTGVTTPTTNNVTINSPMVTPNGTTQYTISHTGADTGGSGKITYQYALIRDNNGINKGWLAWNNAIDSWPTHKNNMACTGGGYAAILSSGSWVGYGDQYIRLISCNTTTTGNSRTTNFVMVFESNYTTTLTNNDILGITYNTNNNYSPWINFDINFGLRMPSLDSITISPSPVIANNTNHTITMIADDPSGGANISHEYSLINYSGANNGQYRGYLSWYYDSAYTGWNALKNKMSCTGGGIAAIQSGYGETYLTLISCSTSISGNKRTVNFVVRFDPSFIVPTTNNMIDTWVQNTFGHNTSWVPGVLFNLTPPSAPTLSASPSTVSPGGTVTLTFANIPVPTVRDWIGQYVLGNTGNSFIAGSEGWKYVGVSPCTQTVPGASRASGSCTFNVSGTPGSYNFRLWDNDNILVQHAVSNTVTVTAPPPSVTLSASPSTVTSGGSSTLTWTVGGSVTSCTASGSWSGARSTSGGSQSTGALVASQTYNLSCTGPGGTTNVTPVTVTVTAPSTNTLNVSANPGPGGRITGTGINCGSDCSENVTAGSTVTLTAVPASSYWRFTGWGGACTGTSLTCSVTVNTNPTTVSATFVPRSFIYREF